MGSTEDCASAVQFFASDLSGYVTDNCNILDGVFRLTQATSKVGRTSNSEDAHASGMHISHVRASQDPADEEYLDVIVPPIFPREHLQRMSRLAQVKVVDSVQEIEAVGDVVAMIYPGGYVDRDFLEKARRLKIISVFGLAYDRIDVRAAAERGILVTNARSAEEDETVAEYATGLLITIARRISEADRFVRDGRWKSTHPIRGKDVYKKTLGIIGLGHIGSLVARRASAFNMKICYYDITRREDLERDSGIKYESLDELLRVSDYVTVHTPLTEKTRGLIGERELRMMKKTAYIINTSRGDVISEEPLIRALKEKWIAGAALDVFRAEPLPEDNPLLALENVLVTPHIAAATEECLERISNVVEEDIIACLEGRMPNKENVVVPIS